MTIGFALVVIDLVVQVRYGRRVRRDPWRATTMEWAMPIPPAPYAFASIPHVDTETDRIAPGDLAVSLARGEGYLGFTRNGWQEALGVHMTTGAPDQLIVLPQPTYLPLVTALVTAGAVLGLLFKFYLLSLAAALVVAGLFVLAAQRAGPRARLRSAAGRPRGQRAAPHRGRQHAAVAGADLHAGGRWHAVHVAAVRHLLPVDRCAELARRGGTRSEPHAGIRVRSRRSSVAAVAARGSLRALGAGGKAAAAGSALRCSRSLGDPCDRCRADRRRDAASACACARCDRRGAPRLCRRSRRHRYHLPRQQLLARPCRIRIGKADRGHAPDPAVARLHDGHGRHCAGPRAGAASRWWTCWGPGHERTPRSAAAPVVACGRLWRLVQRASRSLCAPRLRLRVRLVGGQLAPESCDRVFHASGRDRMDRGATSRKPLPTPRSARPAASCTRQSSGRPSPPSLPPS